MKKLNRVVLIQYFLYEAIELDLSGHVAFLGQNGSGKTSILDAIQIAMLGAHGNYLAFNTQSVSTTGGGKRNPRSIRDYCLGVVDDTGGGGATDRKRDESITYITLIFEDDQTREPVTIGACIRAVATDSNHELLGLYVLNGISLSCADHLEMSDEGEMPLLFNDFVTRARKRCDAAGRTPFFTNQPTKYIHEMIHALQPKAKSIDVREYLKVFNKSVLLRNIESVDSFVRDYVVEPQTIDRRRARQQIDMFKQLNQLLQQVEEQITCLGDMQDAYNKVAHFRSREASIRALAAEYEYKDSRSRAEGLTNSILKAFRSRRNYQHEAKSLANNVRLATESWERANQALLSAKGASDAAVFSQQLQSLKRTFDSTLQRIGKVINAVAGIVNTTATTSHVPELQRQAQEIDNELTYHTDHLAQGKIEGIDAVVQRALRFLGNVLPALRSIHSQAVEELDTATNKLRTLRGLNENAARAGTRISHEVATVIEFLRDQGIKAEPVCNLIQVTDPRWQPAIEALLKSNRESLIVAGGLEREAVRLIRGMPARENPYSAKVVQPYHLRGQHWDSANSNLVGNLLISDNPVALAYLRALVGQMLCVATEEELESNPRALTIDGMLSANFTTSRLRLIPFEQLQFGKRMSQADKDALHKEFMDQVDVEKLAKDKAAKIQSLLERITKLGDLHDMSTRALDDTQRALEEQKSILDTQEQIDSIDTSEYEPLRLRMDECRTTMEDARQAESDNRVHQTETDGALRRHIPQLWAARNERNQRKVAYAEALSTTDVDDAVMDRVRGEIEASLGNGGHSERIDACIRRINRADSDASDAITAAVLRLQSYLDRHGVSLGDELKDWRLALTWVKAELQRLKEIELVERKEEVRQARIAAEEAFRNDVAVRIRESIEQMHTTISDINKTLNACPPFSNGERYRFVVRPAEAHRAIHDYIINVGKGNEQDMFSLGETGHEVIMQLLDDTSQDGKTGFNPLDDYRTLFTFDLMIDREGKKSIPLSRRIGVGSNGEHRTPFYVIAGAAMAAAYRIDAGKHSTGAGLMLLDEAFHGMDQQNALSAARFLDTIGLQMIMAAPEADHSKLAPTLDTIFEITRFDMDVFVEQTKIKEPAKTLLMSDMPSEHPDLLTNMIASLEAGTA
ncbi:SbcC/MukB-like Walker B domain-containing protein [Vogesella indigofera]|uniref:SbcC/MukB-like Walker B domain-containing protein n=1 Tax=Vogesella indigofera TaxID=45465 RepID=UPI0035B3ABAE